MLKRNLGKPTDCIFCSEEESVDHLFFLCIVATKIWKLVSEFFGISIDLDYLSVAKFWIANKKHMAFPLKKKAYGLKYHLCCNALEHMEK
jgi:hypothetical protein